MNLFVVGLPLFTNDMAVEAYRLEYRSSTKLFGTALGYTALDGAMNSPGIETLNNVGIEPFTGGKPIFIDVSQYLLLAGVEKGCKIKHELVVCVLSKDIPMEPIYLEKCADLVARGFTIALDNVEHTRDTAPLFKLARYVIIDSADPEFMATLRLLRIQYPKMKAVIMGIKEKKKFEEIKIVPEAYFCGTFYNKPLTKGVTKVSPLKSNALNLLKMVSDEDFDLSDVSKVIGQDLALSISLLKFINSPAVGIAAKVNSIKAAVALLGQKETRKWITAAVSIYIAQDSPNEITKLSLVRAQFAENLATTFELGIHAPSLFLMGLFSLLDVILEKPMEFAVDAISVNDLVKKALVSREGTLAPVLELIYSYEQADWKNVSYIIVMNNLKPERVYKAFEDSLLWYKKILEYLD